MANSSRFNTPNAQFVVGSTGAVASGYQLYFYASGTSTPLATYSDAALTIPNTNPVVLDSNGNAGSIFLQAAAYKVTFTDPNNVQVWSEDPVSGLVQFNITTNPNITVSPTGNTITTLTSLNVQANAASATTREILVCIGFTSAIGHGTSNDKVALYVGAVGNSGTCDLWSINSLIAASAASGNYTIQGYELDVNNLNVDAAFGNSFQAFGMDISGASTQKCTAAMLISGPAAPNWHVGILVANTSISDYLIQDTCNETTVVGVFGTHSYGFDCSLGATLVPLRMGQSAWIKSRNVANNADVSMLSVSGTNMLFGDATNLTSITTFNNIYPNADNANSLGESGSRFTAVWAVNGTIQTSDSRDKVNIKPLRSTLDFIKGLPLIEYNWEIGGYDQVATTETKLVHDQEEKTVTEEVIRVVDGVPKLVTETRTDFVELYDDVPVLDAAGKPVFRHIEAKSAVYDSSGKLTTPEQPAFDVPLTHRMPRMVEKPVDTVKLIARPGKRLHIGAAAEDIATGLAGLVTGPDENMAGYVLGEDGKHHYRPDQILWALTKAFQEYVTATDSEIKSLKDIISGIKAHLVI